MREVRCSHASMAYNFQRSQLNQLPHDEKYYGLSVDSFAIKSIGGNYNYCAPWKCLSDETVVPLHAFLKYCSGFVFMRLHIVFWVWICIKFLFPWLSVLLKFHMVEQFCVHLWFKSFPSLFSFFLSILLLALSVRHDSVNHVILHWNI